MGDAYRRYGLGAEKSSVARSDFPGHMQPEASSLTSQHSVRPHNRHGLSADYLDREVPASRYGAYGMDAVAAVEHRAEPGLGVTIGSGLRGYPPPVQDTNPASQRRDISTGISPSIPEIMYERPNSLQKADVFSVPEKESNILFVDGLPRDCTRREVGHLFRPFIGFKDIRVVHKEPRRSGEKALVLCFVEFIDAKCALTALEALQGYKFDDKKTDAPSLKISFAHFPFQLPSNRDKLPSDIDNQHIGIPR